MSTVIRTTKEHLARAKSYYHRHDLERSLFSMLKGLGALVKAGPHLTGRTEVDGLLRELVGLYARTDEFRKDFPKGIAFVKGKERALYMALQQVLKKLEEARKQKDYEEILARKLRIDKLLSYGKKLLAVGKVKDAESAFQELESLYTDEHSVFRLIGQALHEAQQYKLAVKYLRRAMKAQPDSKKPVELAIAAYKADGNIPVAAKLEAQLQNM